jgi:hypothetical protein
MAMLQASALWGKSARIFNPLLGFTAANIPGAVNLWDVHDRPQKIIHDPEIHGRLRAPQRSGE